MKAWQYLGIFTAVCSALWSLPTQAFGRTGHEQVCQVALQLVSATTQAKIAKLQQQAPELSFAEGCVWPDEIRNQPEFDYSKPHHFVNVARTSPKLHRHDCAAVGCLLSAIEHQSALLQQSDDPTQQLQALWFIGHFIADLHQPLHVSYADDLGGNRTAVYFLKQPANLHGIWDSALLRELGYEQQPDLLLKKVTALEPSLRQQWQAGHPLLWGNESLALTRQIYQDYRPGMLFDATQVQRDAPLVEKRLMQAAVRLAWWLDRLWIAD